MSGGSPPTLGKTIGPRSESKSGIKLGFRTPSSVLFTPQPGEVGTAMSQPPLLRCYPAWTDHAGGQLRGRPELAESCFCFCQSQALSSNTHTPSRGRCARAQTKPEEFLFLPSQVRDRRGCTMRPSDSTSYTMRRRSCKPCSAGVLIVNPDALSLRFSALTFRLKVNLSVCSMCLKKSSKPPCRGAPHRFC